SEHEEAVARFAVEEPSTDLGATAFQLAVRKALDALHGARWAASPWPANLRREPDPVIVAAIRATLVPWALEPHPVRLLEGTKGALLELRVGRGESFFSWRY